MSAICHRASWSVFWQYWPLWYIMMMPLLKGFLNGKMPINRIPTIILWTTLLRNPDVITSSSAITEIGDICLLWFSVSWCPEVLAKPKTAVLPLLTVQSVLCVALQGTGYFCVRLASSHGRLGEILQEKCTFLPVMGYPSLPSMC